MTEHSTETVPQSEQDAPPKWSAALKVSVRLAIGVAVVGILLARTDRHALVRVIANADVGYIVGAFLLFLVVLGVGAIRWRAFLPAVGIDLPWPDAFRMYFVGTFFNAFLPTGIGGDAYKAVRIGRGPGLVGPAFSSVFLDRYAGMVGLGVVGGVSVLIRLSGGDDGRVVVAAGFLCVAIVAVSILVFPIGERLARPGGRVGRFDIRGKLRRTLRAFLDGARDWHAGRVGYPAGVLAQALLVVTNVLLARSLGLSVPVAALSAIVVVTTIVTTIPLTINGLGFREGAYVWGLQTYGVPHAEALAFALLVLGVLLAASAVGGLVYVLLGGEVRVKDRL